MDQKNKKIIIRGLAIAILTSSILVYLRYSKKSLDYKMNSSLQKCIKVIEKKSQLFLANKNENLQDNSIIIKILIDYLNEYVDINLLADEVSKYAFGNQINKINYHFKLANIKLSTQYLKNRQSLNQCNLEIQKITQDVELPEGTEFNYSQNAQSFLQFIILEFVSLITQIEELFMIDQGKQNKIIQINLYFKSIVDMCSQILNKQPHFKILIVKALFIEIKNINQVNKFYHKCNDYENANKLSRNEPNLQCQCVLISLILRYISIITPAFQNSFCNFLIEYQILFTKQSLIKIGVLLLGNAFSLTHQLLDENNILFQISPLNNLLILPCSIQSVRYQIINKFPQNLTWYLYCQKQILVRNHPKFWQEFVPYFIDSHLILYSLFSDQQTLQLLLNNDKTEDLLTHFIIILLILETKQASEISQEQDQQKITFWFSTNLELLLSSEVIVFLQLQFIQKIIGFYKEISFPIIAKVYLKCLKQSLYENSQNFQVNAYIFRSLGFLIMISQQDLPTMHSLEKIVNMLPFKDKEERQNIFNSILALLFEWPSKNYNFLKYLHTVCQQQSLEASMNFQRYYTQILYSPTLVIENFMVSLQLSIFFGKQNVVFEEMRGRLENSFQIFEQDQIYIQRYLVLIVDMLENPYYCLNILRQNESNFPKLKDLEASLIQRAAISLMDINKEMYLQEFYESLSRFLYLKDVPSYIMDLLVLNRNGKYSLKHSHSQTTCFMYLQKDLDSLNNYLSQVHSYYDELLHPIESFPYLKELRNIIYQNENFIGLIQCCIRTKHRMKIEIWNSKFLYYGKEVLLSNPSNQLLQDLFKDPQVNVFIEELQKQSKGNASQLVNYLKLK